MQQEGPFSRMETLFGAEAMARLARSTVAIFGVGGVGGHCAEALARCGIGRFVLVDMDRVTLTNLNRQAVALHSTLGLYKVEVMRARILDINPDARVATFAAYYGPEHALPVWDAPLDIVIDAIDTVAAKVDLAVQAQARGIACVSCMGAGNKLDPTRFEVADLYDTSVCPLCRATRRIARQRGLDALRVVYSKETPAAQPDASPSADGDRRPPGSVVYVTATAGLLLAREAVQMLLAGEGPARKCEQNLNYDHFPQK